MSETFGPDHIPREELVKDSARYLEEKGHGNKMRAHYLQLLSNEVIGSSRPEFRHLQAHIQEPISDAWDNAYHLVLEYLKDNGLNFTQKVLMAELNDLQLSEPTNYPNKTSEEYLDELFSISNEERTPFSERVEQFISAVSENKNETTDEIIDGEFEEDQLESPTRPPARLAPTSPTQTTPPRLATQVHEDNSPNGGTAFLTQPVMNSPPSPIKETVSKPNSQPPTSFDKFGGSTDSDQFIDDDIVVDITDDDVDKTEEPKPAKENSNPPQQTFSPNTDDDDFEIDDDDFAIQDDDV